MTKQTPMGHAKSLRIFERGVGDCDKLLTKEEIQKEKEGLIEVGRQFVWVHPQDTPEKSTPTKVPVAYMNKSVGKELHDFKQVDFTHNTNIRTHSDNCSVW